MKALALKEYRAAIAALGRERRTSVLREALRLAYFRLYSGKGAALYVSHGLADVPPSAWNEYLDKREMCVLQKKVNDPTDFPALDDKLLFDERCRKHGVPAPEIEAVIGSATIGPPGYNYLKSSADLARFALNRSGRDFVVKIRNGTYGIGLRAIRCTSEGIVDLATGEGTTPDRFFAELDVARSDYLVQPRLVRCNELRDVMPGLALGTVRIITFIQRDGTVLVPYALIKLPITGPVADNFVHGQSGNLISGIDVAGGTMINAFGRPRGKHLPTKFHTHPETGCIIVGRPVPRWHDVLNLSVRAAKAFGEMRTVGWDIGITDEGPMVIEGNRTYDADLLQITLQRGLRSEIERLFHS